MGRVAGREWRGVVLVRGFVLSQASGARLGCPVLRCSTGCDVEVRCFPTYDVRCADVMDGAAGPMSDRCEPSACPPAHPGKAAMNGSQLLQVIAIFMTGPPAILPAGGYPRCLERSGQMGAPPHAGHPTQAMGSGHDYLSRVAQAWSFLQCGGASGG